MVNSQRYCAMIPAFFDGALQNFPGHNDELVSTGWCYSIENTRIH